MADLGYCNRRSSFAHFRVSELCLQRSCFGLCSVTFYPFQSVQTATRFQINPNLPALRTMHSSSDRLRCTTTVCNCVGPAVTLNVNHTFYQQEAVSYFLTLLVSSPENSLQS